MLFQNFNRHRLQTLLHVEPVQIYDKEDRRFKGENQETI